MGPRKLLTPFVLSPQYSFEESHLFIAFMSLQPMYPVLQILNEVLEVSYKKYLI